ncbi:hypothetical protein KIH74_04405 [Kineosporia sp. J2-2]|uniref:Uncharacterized protein n=1 Tax=Kineosporia corallincola TaxID=2835133 RepID=A0ABS5TAQ1_9ACTN|nr:hypothetical protein [Kineosporia corallincola]MBT0768150.1 hypothetical protein [Kineosporia corallincola]
MNSWAVGDVSDVSEGSGLREPGTAEVPDPPETPDLDDWHHLLLRMAGALPDEAISDARAWLAEGAVQDVASVVAFAAVARQTPVWDLDTLVLLDELERAGDQVEALSDLVVTQDVADASGAWAFAPVRVRTEVEAETETPVLDLTAVRPDPDDEDDGDDGADRIDRAAVQAVQDESEVVALWRAWRVPAAAHARFGPVSPDSRRVYLVAARVSADGALAGLAARLQLRLLAAGEDDPQVEVWPEGGGLPPYQSAAWLRSALLWAREPGPVLRLARSFDAVRSQEGPQFDPGHPRIEETAEIARLLEYLGGAALVLASDVTMPDVLEPGSGAVVPLSLRTDGTWIWSDSVAYYLERYGLSPEPELWEHLRAQAGGCPPVSAVALHRAWCLLVQGRDTTDAEVVWQVPVPSGVP